MSSQAHQTAPLAASPTQQPQRSPAPEHAQVGGNQQALDEAGLASGASEPDTSLLGPYAEMLLSAMPLSAALPMALPFVENPVVRDWIRSLAPEAVAGILGTQSSLSRYLLDTLWPAGIGFEVGGFGDLGLNLGAGFEATRSVLNADGVVFDEAIEATVRARLDTAAGGHVTDAFGHGTQIGADAALALVVQVTARAFAPIPAQWWTVLDKTASDVVMAACTQTSLPTQLQTGVAPGEAFAVQVTASAGPEASAAAAAVRPEAMPAWLGDALEPLLERDGGAGQGPDLSRLHVELDAHLGAAATLRTVARASPGGVDWGVALEGTLAGMAAGGLGTLLRPDDGAALQEAARWEGGASLVATVHAGIHAAANTLSPEQDWLESLELRLGSVELATRQPWGAVEHSETTCFPSFTALLATRADLSEVPDRDGTPLVTRLSEVLSSGATLARTQATHIALDPAQLVDLAPGIWGTVLDRLGLDETRVGPTATAAELALEGTVAVDHAVLEAAADAGVVAPGPTAGNALEETADALFAAAKGTALPNWAVPWTAALEALGPDLWVQSQIRGWAGVGVGGSLSMGEGAKGSASSGLTTRIRVELPTTPAQHLQLTAAAR